MKCKRCNKEIGDMISNYHINCYLEKEKELEENLSEDLKNYNNY